VPLHTLPTWFLVVALFLPRIALFTGWINEWVFRVPQPASALLWFFLPRILVLITIYDVMGTCAWFWIHLVVAILTYVSFGSHTTSRNQ
jgi:hypothetical protein